MKNILVVGATGMIGSLVINECLTHSEISSVTAITRKPLGYEHAKLKTVIHSDFSDYSAVSGEFENKDIAFFCIGVYTGQVDTEMFRKITVEYAVNFATTLKHESPDSTLCFLSGAGADRTEKSNVLFAKYKGMAENKISTIGLKSWFSFRPGYIYPVTTRKEPNMFYQFARYMYPLIRLFGKNSSIKSTELAKAMLYVGLNGFSNELLENRDIYNESRKTGAG